MLHHDPECSLAASTYDVTRSITQAAPPSATTPEDVWSSLTDVERTCLQTSFSRLLAAKECHRPDGSPLYDDSLGEMIVQRCMPPEKQQELGDMTLQVSLN